MKRVYDVSKFDKTGTAKQVFRNTETTEDELLLALAVKSVKGLRGHCPM
jgi:hypothetical protein